MLALQLLCNGIVTGCALGIVAVSFSFIYATTKIFHVAHAGVYTMGGYVAWSMLRHGFPVPVAFLVGGVVAVFSVYSYAKLGACFPSRKVRRCVPTCKRFKKSRNRR